MLMCGNVWHDFGHKASRCESKARFCETLFKTGTQGNSARRPPKMDLEKPQTSNSVKPA